MSNQYNQITFKNLNLLIHNRNKLKLLTGMIFILNLISNYNIT
jgi:hypothetical protein